MRKLEYHSGATTPFNEKYRPTSPPEGKEKEGRDYDGMFFVVGIFVGLILSWIIL
jgi:hypothetical protein